MNKLIFKSNFIFFLVIICSINCAPINEQLVPIDQGSDLYGEVQLYVYEYNSKSKIIIPNVVTDKIIYHTSIVVNDLEFAYSDEGAKMTAAGKSTNLKILGKLALGKTDLEIDDIIEEFNELKESFTKENYDFLSHNCNHFSNELAIKLEVNPIPEKYLVQGESGTILNKVGEVVFGQSLPLFKSIGNWVSNLF